MSDNKPKAIGALKRNNSKTPSLPKGKHYLFAIAINQYVHAPKLSNCIKDADDFILQLTELYQFSTENVFRLYNEQATLPNIYNQLKELSKKIKSQDSLIIYFSGHGYMDKSDKSGHLVPVDGAKDAVWTYLSNDNLLSRIRAIKSFHTFLIVDSCFSGTLFMNRSMDSSALAEEVGRYPSRWGLAAGRIEEVADGYHGENSPFAKALLSFLKTNTSAKFPVSELIQYVKKVTPRNSDQTPVGGPIFKAGDMDGEFIFELEESEIVFGNKKVAPPTSTVTAPTSVSSNTSTSFLQKNGKYLVLALLVPFLLWGISKWMSPAPTLTNSTKNNTTLTEIPPTEQPPITEQLDLSFVFGSNEVQATINGGKSPYRLFLKKDGKVKHEQTINTASQHNIAITEAYRKDAGEYQLVVKDANDNQQQKTVTIDMPKVRLKKRGLLMHSDGQTYRWVRLQDGKKWMSENLNFKTTDSWCFDNDEKNCEKYGRLYTWDAAMNACPKGWRLPSDKDWWNILSPHGKVYSKARGNTGSDAGLNVYENFSKDGKTGLDIQLGSKSYINGKFAEDELNKSGYYWSNTKKADKIFVYSFSKSGNGSDMNQSFVGTGVQHKKYGFSCRCIQD